MSNWLKVTPERMKTVINELQPKGVTRYRFRHTQEKGWQEEFYWGWDYCENYVDTLFTIPADRIVVVSSGDDTIDRIFFICPQAEMAERLAWAIKLTFDATDAPAESV